MHMQPVSVATQLHPPPTNPIHANPKRAGGAGGSILNLCNSDYCCSPESIPTLCPRSRIQSVHAVLRTPTTYARAVRVLLPHTVDSVSGEPPHDWTLTPFSVHDGLHGVSSSPRLLDSIESLPLHPGGGPGEPGSRQLRERNQTKRANCLVSPMPIRPPLLPLLFDPSVVSPLSLGCLAFRLFLGPLLTRPAARTPDRRPF